MAGTTSNAAALAGGTLSNAPPSEVTATGKAGTTGMETSQGEGHSEEDKSGTGGRFNNNAIWKQHGRPTTSAR